MMDSPSVPEDLIAKALQGNYTSFTQLVERYKGLIYQLAYQMTGHKEDALDITQDVCVKLHLQLKSYDRRHQFSSWLYRLTINASIDYHRRTKRHKIGSLDGDAEHGQRELPDMKDEPRDRAAKEELAAVFRALADELPVNQRTVFVLKDLEERESAEIAAMLDITEATVRSHLHAARKKIRQRLQEQHPALLESFL